MIRFKKKNKSFSVIDLGCGYGDLLYALKKEGFLKNVRFCGVDNSAEKIRIFKKTLPEAKSFQSDILKFSRKLKKDTFDLVICNQVIEHLENDQTLVLEIKNLLKKGGLCYLTSVIKKWYGLYWYRNKYGRIVVDPTHLHEYQSQKDFQNLLVKNGFKIINLKIYPGHFPMFDYFLLLLKKLGILRFESMRYFYLNHPVIYMLARKTSFFPIPGYATIEAVAKKR